MSSVRFMSLFVSLNISLIFLCILIRILMKVLIHIKRPMLASVNLADVPEKRLPWFPLASCRPSRTGAGWNYDSRPTGGQ